MRIKFTRDVTTKEAKPQTFKKDQVVDFPDDESGKASAQHWINRGAAEEVTEESSRSAKAGPAKSEPAKPESLVSGPAHKGHGGKTEAL